MDPVKKTSRPSLARRGAWVAAIVAFGSVPSGASRSAAASVRQESGEGGYALSRPSMRLEPRPFPLESPVGSEPLPPEGMGFHDWPGSRARLANDVYRRSRGDPLADVGDAFLQGPELLIDGILSSIGSFWEGATLRDEEGEVRGVTTRMLELRLGPGPQRISAAFLKQWTGQELKYLGAFEESRVNTYAFQDGTEDADLHELAVDQRKVFWSALRRTYLTRYKMQFHDQIPEESWALGRWNAADFVVLPPLMAGYLYYRGLEQDISMGDTALRIAFEPVCELIRGNGDRPMAVALEWTIRGIPVGLIVSVGLQEDRYGMDFVGIGTTLGAVQRALENQDSRR